jgi:hypothetical protein
LNRVTNFNHIVVTNGWDVDAGCVALTSASIEAAVALCNIVREVNRLSPKLLTVSMDPASTTSQQQLQQHHHYHQSNHVQFIQSLWFLVVVSIHHACVSHSSDRACSPLIRVASMLFKDIIQHDPNIINLSEYLNESSISFMLNTMFQALGKTTTSMTRSSTTTAAHAQDDLNNNLNEKGNVNPFFVRFISDILFTLLYEPNTQPFIQQICHHQLAAIQVKHQEDELLMSMASRKWFENGRRVNRQKFVKFISQVSVVFGGHALPQSALDLM